MCVDVQMVYARLEPVLHVVKLAILLLTVALLSSKILEVMVVLVVMVQVDFLLVIQYLVVVKSTMLNKLDQPMLRIPMQFLLCNRK